MQTGSIACLDAAYGESAATCACIVADGWTAGIESGRHVIRTGAAADYEPGEFYRRELPLLLAALKAVGTLPDVIVIDGYVWLGEGRKGLGAHLHQALGGERPVVGVAKTEFRSASAISLPVMRGSARPLFVTAEGMSVDAAADCVKRMHGAHRIPTLLKLADRAARDALPA